MKKIPKAGETVPRMAQQEMHESISMTVTYRYLVFSLTPVRNLFLHILQKDLCADLTFSEF
jgi:hypothetical protein